MKENLKSKNPSFRHIRQFESLKMKEEENIGEYLLRVDEVVNAIRGLGGKLKEREVVRKVLRTFPMNMIQKYPP